MLANPTVEMVTNTTAETQAHRTRSRFWLIFITVLALLNLTALALAWSDRGLGGVLIALYLGPVANGVLALIALAATPFLKRWRPGFSVWCHVALSFGIPTAAVMLDGLLIILLIRPSAC